MIRLICSNKKCAYTYSVSDDEFRMNGKYHSHCLLCGCKNELNNLEEIVASDLDQKVKDNVDTYIKMLGIEGAWELIERNKEHVCSKLYFAELKRRGINLK
jgi:hypothetical protein